MNFIKKLFSQLIHIGVDQQTPQLLIERILFSNIVFFAPIPLCLMAIPSNTSHHHVLINLLNVMLIATCVGCLWLNSHRHYLASRVTYMASCGFLLFVEGLSTGTLVPNDHYLFVFAALSSLMFHSSERRLSLGISLGFCMAYFAAENLTPPAFLSDGSSFTISDRYTVQVLFLIAFMVSIRALAVANDKANIALKGAYSEIKEKTTLIESMLNSINEAFLIFDKNGVCQGSPSQASIKLLGVDPYQKNISELIEPNEEKRKDLLSWFSLLFFERLNFEETALRGPKILQTNGGKTSLKLGFHPLLNDERKIHAVIFTATEITKEVQAQKQIDIERERADMILRIFENKSSFRRFLGEFETILQRLLNGRQASLETVRRDLHTLKGTAMLFGVASLAREMYAFELKLNALGESETLNLDLAWSLIQVEAKTILQSFVSWRARELGLFTKLGVFDDGSIDISLRKMKELTQKYERRLPAEMAEVLSDFAIDLRRSEFGDLLKDFEEHVQSTAARLGKKVAFQVNGPAEPVFVEPNAYRETLRTLVHLFNNAVDHGIESPEARRKNNKPEQGLISLSYERVQRTGQNWISLRIDDDGGGIDLTRIRAKTHDQSEDLEVAMRIFDDGVTTRDEVTELSGQGIGMGAVRAAILKLRGKVKIVKTDRTGTSFEILLPDFAQNIKTQPATQMRPTG